MFLSNGRRKLFCIDYRVPLCIPISMLATLRHTISNICICIYIYIYIHLCLYMCILITPICICIYISVSICVCSSPLRLQSPKPTLRRGYKGYATLILCRIVSACGMSVEVVRRIAEICGDCYFPSKIAKRSNHIDFGDQKQANRRDF